ncbi:class I SAM-dependent DNA methyltransferase [Nesterenkonia xinjiangensis]|uniref:SAM-dependent methyltransferase n=1 Tax=Nesterenkonia xinjiangensis TaxID=225327 RepID=A0A7Z0K8I7_9MICC|nr:class I SAM-dependent methyltransferase [Nesterenkonia xinjiangensis]NYJ77689.1 SAM-dependent methyltransferase [Nesterenkonia xinjiangensis]
MNHAETDRRPSSQVWSEATASRYDDTLGWMGTSEAVEPVVDALARLAGSGRALEFAVGTGRIAVPLAARGVPVEGIELSAPMVEKLRTKADAGTVPVTLGDMATTRVPGEFSLVYLVYNTISNLLTQQEQVECFRNAARHLIPGGRFVIELGVPPLRRLPPGQLACPFEVTEEHLGFDVVDPVTQRLTSHHHWPARGVHGQSEHRYIWPAECDLMAQMAGLAPEHRAADWHGSEFTAESDSHVSVWRRPAPS